MPKTLRAAAAGSCRTSAVTPLSSRLSQWASAAGLVPTGLCRWPLPAGRTSWFSALAAPASALPSALVRVAPNPHDCASRLEPPHDLHRWPRLGWSLLGSRLCACFEFGLGGGEFGGHLLSGHGDLALVPVDGGCLALRAGAGVRTGGPRLPPRLTLPARSQPRRDLRRRPVKATHRGGIQRPMRTDLAFGSPPAEQSTLRVVPSEPGHRSRRGVYLALSSLPPLLLLELHGPRDLNPRTGKVDNRARRQVSTSTQVAARRRAGISDLPSPGEVSRAPCRDGGGQQSKATMRKRVWPPGSVTRSIMPSGGSSQERASDGSRQQAWFRDRGPGATLAGGDGGPPGGSPYESSMFHVKHRCSSVGASGRLRLPSLARHPNAGPGDHRATSSEAPARSGPGEGALRETGGGLRSRRRGTWSTRPPTGEHPHSADQFPRRR
jgi:hypothetical protein